MSVESVNALIFGRWRSQVLYTGVKLGVFEAIPQEGSKSSDDVAKELTVDPRMLYRLMRAIASLGLLKEHSAGRFSITPDGKLLREDHPQTLRGITLLEEGPQHYAIWKHLPEIVRDGRQNAFLREFGSMGFDYAAKSPEYERVFNDAMSSYSSIESAQVLEALEGCDISRISHLCDIGGGKGHLLSSILKRYPHLEGTVIEIPSVIEDKDSLWARKLGVGDRCSYLGGDMFKEVPRADAYIMKHIIHDWDDSQSTQILSNVRKSAVDKARLFIAEYVVPDPDTPHFSKFFDIHMMCWGTGRERTNDEYAELLRKSGWSYVKTWYPASKLMGVVEAVVDGIANI